MTGVYSIAEVVDDSNKRPSKTILCILDDYDGKFNVHQFKSLKMVASMVERNDANVFYSLSDVAEFLNKGY